MKREPKVEVVFRKDEDGVFALFPYIPWNRRGTTVTYYAHMGQHSGLNYHYAVMDSRPAKPEEYADLLAELKGIGYRLRVIKRASHRRMEQAARKQRELFDQLEKQQHELLHRIEYRAR